MSGLQILKRKKKRDGRYHKDLANRCQTRGRFEEARLHWQRALDANPHDLAARLAFCKVLRRLGRDSEAVAEHIVLSKRYMQTGCTMRAAAIAMAGLEIEPDNAELKQQLESLRGWSGVHLDAADEATTSERETATELKEIPPLGVFKRLESEFRARFADQCPVLRLDTGDPVIEVGQGSEAVYLVLQGEVRVSKQRTDRAWRVISHLGKGELIGEQAVLRGSRHTSNVVSSQPSRLLKIRRSILTRMLADSSDFATAVYRRSLERWFINFLSQHRLLSEVDKTTRSECLSFFDLGTTKPEHPFSVSKQNPCILVLALGGEVQARWGEKTALLPMSRFVGFPREKPQDMKIFSDQATFFYVLRKSGRDAMRELNARVLNLIESQAVDFKKAEALGRRRSEETDNGSSSDTATPVPKATPVEAVKKPTGEIRVGEAISRDVHSVPPHFSLLGAVELMKSEQISCIVVCNENQEAVGIFSERDLVWVMELNLTSQGMSEVEIGACMSSPVTTASESMLLTEAVATMQVERIRRLPVVDDGNKLVGILTQTDIIRALTDGGSEAATFSESSLHSHL